MLRKVQSVFKGQVMESQFPNLKHQSLFLVGLIFLLTLVFLPFPGTSDIKHWARWIMQLEQHGLIAGYKAINADYPPLASTLLYCLTKPLIQLGFSLLNAIKFSIFCALLASTFVIWLWTRQRTVTLVFHVAVLLACVGLSYIDILFAPALLLSLWALSRNKLLLFSLLYTLAVFIKWQPIIIAPFIALYLIKNEAQTSWNRERIKSLMMNVLIPVSLLLVIIILVFGFSPVYQAFDAATSHKYLSANALNVNWILTHYLHIFNPQEYGGLKNGMATFIITDNPSITLAPKLLFIIFYLVLLFVFFRQKKSFEHLILFSLAGYLSYFLFNTGVHENHLFLVVLLSILLWWSNQRFFITALILILISNINLFVFYGMDGIGVAPIRTFGFLPDIALILTIFNVCFVLYFIISLLQQYTKSKNLFTLTSGAE